MEMLQKCFFNLQGDEVYDSNSTSGVVCKACDGTDFKRCYEEVIEEEAVV